LLIEVATPLLELACLMGSHSVTCHPVEVTFQLLPQPKLVLDLDRVPASKLDRSWWNSNLIIN